MALDPGGEKMRVQSGGEDLLSGIAFVRAWFYAR